MKIYSAQLKGTTTVATGSNVSLTGSFTGSIYGFNDTLQYSSSVDSRIVVNTNRLNNIESKSASVDISISNINSVTASNIARLSNLESKSASVDISISNINAVTASNIARLSNLETKSSSVDISITNINSFTASNGNTSLNQLTGSLATTGSNSFYGTQVFSGSVYIANDLVVQGSSSIQYISASSVSIGTNIVQLNTANPSVRYAGLTIIDSGSIGGSGSFLYDSVHDEFVFVHRGNGSNITSSHFVLGPETFDNLGNETYLTCNRLPKGTGKEHLIDSCIFDNGTTTCIKNNLVGTGTMSGTTIYGSTAVCSPVGLFSGCIGIGTITPLDNLHIAASEIGNVGISIQNTNASYSSQLRFLNCAGTEKAAVTFVQSTTSLNLNINSIEALIISSAGASSFSSCVAGDSIMNITNTSPTGKGITLTAGDDYTSYAIKVLDYAGVEKLRLDGNGNLLVGYCTDQGYKFGVNGTSIFSGAAIFSSSITSPNITLNTTSDGFNMLCLVSTGGDAGMYLRGGATNGGGWTIQAQNSCNFAIVDRTAGSNPVRFNIASGGNIGIGATCSTFRLYVQDFNPANCFCSISVFSNSGGSDRLHIKDEDGNNQNPPGIWTSTGYGTGIYNCSPSATAGIKFFTGAPLTQKVIINVCGSVGIGTSCPNYPLHVYKSSGTSIINVESATGQNSQYRIEEAGVVKFAITYVPSDTTTRMYFAGHGTDLITLKASNVGIGTVAPNNRLEVQKTTATEAAIFINQCNSNEATIRFKSTHDANSDYRVGASILVNSAFEIYHVNCAVNRFWISQCGAIMMGTGIDTAINSSDMVHKIGANTGGTSYARLMMQERAGCWISFNNGSGTNYGVIQVSGAGVSYGSNSDYRLKTNIQNMVSSCGLNRIMCLRPVTFDWIHHCIQGEGFIAHELQEYIPSAVSGEKDAVNETGCASYQTVDAKNIVPSLVKAIQEQQCTINLLKSCIGIV